MIRKLLIILVALSLIASGCATTPAPESNEPLPEPQEETPVADQPEVSEPVAEGGGDVTLTVATVNNPDMVIMSELTSQFTEETGIEVEFVTLPDQQLRQQVTQDVAMGTGTYDIVTIGPDEIQTTWAKNEWVEPLDPYFASMSEEGLTAYDLEDVIQPIRDRLTIDGHLYGLPFYGESNFTYYRKDLFDEAGLTMPEEPTWDEIRSFAAELHDPENGVYGIILKGIAEYGQLAPFMTFVNSFGARWFDMEWQPQFTSPEFSDAAHYYVDLVQNYGEPGASNVGFNEGLGLMAQGKGAIWVDATVAAGALNDPETSEVVGLLDYAMAPTQGCTNGSHWLYSWNLTISAASKNKEEAFQFITWATSKDYIELVGENYGWGRIPPGTRASTYSRSEYRDIAPWADITLKSIMTTTPTKPSCQPIPYLGDTQIDIPEWPAIAFDFAQGFSAAVAGTTEVDEWLQNAESVAVEVLTEAGYIE
jgi:sorbitol/mannitol transport system substrate-binding protein